MLCYIESDKYGNDLALLEEVVTTFTYFPLNEICGGFFFGSFNILTALEDMSGLQSLYLKTQVHLTSTPPTGAEGFVGQNGLSMLVRLLSRRLTSQSTAKLCT